MTTFTVRSNAELADLLSRIDTLGGGTIKLEATETPYQIVGQDLGSAGTPVTITAADPSAPPVVDRIDLRDASHVTLSGLDIHGKEKGNPHSIYISDSNAITLTNNVMTGVAEEFVSQTNGALQANGAMLLRDSTDITVTHNTISNFSTAIGVLEIDGLVIAHNDISQMQADGIQGAGFRNAEITDNHLHDFLGTTQTINHSDMIQIWGKNAKSVTENVVISGNLLDAGDGALSQGIFILNEDFGQGSAPENGHFKNITITDNVIHNSAPHGIAVGHVDGLVIQSNTLLKSEAAYLFRDDGSVVYPTEPRYQVTESKNVTGTDNIGTDYLGQISEAGNTVLVYDNPADAMYVHNHIVNLSGQGDIGQTDLQLRPDSPLWGTAGAAISSPSETSQADLGPVIMATKTLENALARELDASAGALPDGTSATWHFADGTSIDGPRITHVFEAPGVHAVTLTLTHADGSTASTTRKIEIADPYLFAFDFADGAADLTNRGIDAEVTGTAAQAFVSTVEDKGFYLNPNTGLTLGRENTQLFGLEAFNIDLRYKQTQAMEDGGLLGIHTVFKLDILPDGALSFWLRTGDGDFTVTTDPGVMNTTAWQDIGVRYDGAAGTLALLVNGDTLASGSATGATSGPLSWGLQLGRPWGDDAKGVFESVSMSLPHDASATGTAPVAPAPTPDTPAPQPAPADPPAPPSETTGSAAQPPLPDPSVLLDVDFSDDGRDKSIFDAWLNTAAEDPGFTDGKEGAGFRIGADSIFRIDNTATHLFGLDAFNIALDIRKDSADAHGGLLNQHTILDLSLRADGGFILALATDEGSVRLSTDAGLLSDTDWHRVNVIYDDAAGQVALLLDGTSIAEAALTGRTGEAAYWDFVVGDPWQDGVAAVVDNLKITVPDAEGTAAPDPDPAPAPAPQPDTPLDPDPDPAPAPSAAQPYTLLDVDFSNGGQDLSGYGAKTIDRTRGEGFTEGKEGAGFEIGGFTTFRIDNTATQLFGLDSFDIGFDFRRDESGGHGGLLNQQEVLDLNMRADGALRFKLITDEGIIRMRTEPGVLSDDGWHRINITYDSAAGLAQIIVDGESLAARSLTGTTAEAGKRDFIIGDPFEDSAAGVIDNLQITRVATPEELATMTQNTATSSASALQPLFDQLDTPEDPANAPMNSFAPDGSFDQAWDQSGIDALSDGGTPPDPLLPL